MRILFSRPLRYASNDAPEKPKSKTRKMFRMAPDLAIPLQVAAPQQQQQQQQPRHEYEVDEDDGVVEIDLRCALKSILLLICTLFVFVCGAVFASQEPLLSTRTVVDETVVEKPLLSAEDHPLAVLRSGEQQQQQQQNVFPDHPDHPNHTRTARGSGGGLAPVEFIKLHFEEMQSRHGALGSMEQCVNLILQSSTLRVDGFIFEDHAILLRPSAGRSDALLETLGGQATIEKIQTCARVVIHGRGVFVYR